MENETINQENPTVNPDSKPRFPVDEKVIAVLMIGVAYLYVFGLIRGLDIEYKSTYLTTFRVCFAIFGTAYLAFAMVLYRKVKFTFESGIWMACVLITLVRVVSPVRLGSLFGLKENVWEDIWAFFFLHAFAIYFTLARSDRLAEHKSSHFLPFDAVDGTFIIPFKRIYLQVQAIIHIFSDRSHDAKDGKKKGHAVLWALVALVVAVIFFIIALNLLAKADDNFEKMVQGFLDLFEIEWGEYITYFILSIPVGLYVFGMLAGMRHETRAHIEGRSGGLMKFVTALGKVPAVVWACLLFGFSAVYMVFFGLQGQYLFGAFLGKLPEGFTYSSYARQGFFELLQIMVINFALLWFSGRTSNQKEKRSVVLFVAQIVLLAASMLFAAISFAKLFMYIDVFGFTPLRIKSSWLVVVLFLGCICTLVHLVSGKKTVRPWIIFSGATLALMCLL